MVKRLVGSSTAALLPVHRSRRQESRARSTARAASSASSGAPAHPAWPVSASGSLADYLSTCQSLTLLPSVRRSKVNQYENKSLVKIEHVNDKVDTDFYMGKRYATAQIEQR